MCILIENLINFLEIMFLFSTKVMPVLNVPVSLIDHQGSLTAASVRTQYCMDSKTL